MAVELTRRQAFMVLNGLPSIGPIGLNRLLEAFGDDPAAVLGASPAALRHVAKIGPVTADTVCSWRKHFRLEREEAKLDAGGTRFITREDDGYPELLREIHDPPIGLYSLGDYKWADRSVAIVGSRRSTLYGQ